MFTFLESDLVTEYKIPADAEGPRLDSLKWQDGGLVIPSDRPDQMKDFATFVVGQAESYDWWEHMIDGEAIFSTYVELFGNSTRRERYHPEVKPGWKSYGKQTEAKFFAHAVATNGAACGTMIDPTGINIDRMVGQEDVHDRNRDHFPVGYQPLYGPPEVIVTPDQLTDETNRLPRLRQVPNDMVGLFGERDSHAVPYMPPLGGVNDKRAFMTLRLFPRETNY